MQWGWGSHDGASGLIRRKRGYVFIMQEGDHLQVQRSALIRTWVGQYHDIGLPASDFIVKVNLTFCHGSKPFLVWFPLLVYMSSNVWTGALSRPLVQYSMASRLGLYLAFFSNLLSFFTWTQPSMIEITYLHLDLHIWPASESPSQAVPPLLQVTAHWPLQLLPDIKHGPSPFTISFWIKPFPPCLLNLGVSHCLQIPDSPIFNFSWWLRLLCQCWMGLPGWVGIGWSGALLRISISNPRRSKHTF